MTTYYDNHMHILSPLMIDTIGKELCGEMGMDIVQEPEGDRSAYAVVMWLDKAGFTKGTMISSAFTWTTSAMNIPEEETEHRVREENNWAATQQKRYPGRVRSIMSFNPMETEMAIREMDRCSDVLKMGGIKLHFDANKVDLLEPEHVERVRPVFQHAASKGLPLLVHYGIKNNPLDKGSICPEAMDIFFREIFHKSPGLRVQFAHCIGLYSKATEDSFLHLTDIRRRDPLAANNIWVDISAMFVDSITEAYYQGLLPLTRRDDHDRIAQRLRDFGLERVVFGSDYSASPTLNPYDYSNFLREKSSLSESELEGIFSNPGPFWE